MQIGSAAILSVTTTVAMIEIGVTAASLLTATRSELAMPLLLHHALPLFACDYVTRTHFGTAVILTALFQETTNPESNSTTSTPCSRLAGMPSAASATPGVRGR